MKLSLTRPVTVSVEGDGSVEDLRLTAEILFTLMTEDVQNEYGATVIDRDDLVREFVHRPVRVEAIQIESVEQEQTWGKETA